KLVAVGIFEIRESDLGNSHEYVLTEKGRDFHTSSSQDIAFTPCGHFGVLLNKPATHGSLLKV
ncbi:hypothetical protein, partial [Streptomyces sp. NPDC057062]|uniref:hypothetical protein n=1 Tax=Streptomyces sp. NPDC057062 TaxID=3346011 RepID=UPI0036D3B93D